MSRIVILLVSVWLTAGWGQAQDFRFVVRHDHDPWGKCIGEMTVTPQGIAFHSQKDEHSIRWSWLDIQTVDRLSPLKFSVVTYKDQKWLAGRDRPWDFTVIEGAGLTDEAFALIEDGLKTPVVDRMVKPIADADYEVPVKHLHTLGGCEGILRFTPDWIVFESENPKDSRSWRRNSQVTGIWSAGRYDLDIVVLEREGGDLSGTRRFRFQLKEPLDQAFYTKLRRSLLPNP